MQTYKYSAVNLRNQTIRGTFIAKDEKDLAEQLAKQDLFLISAAPYSGKTPSAFFTLGTGKVGTGELTGFCRQFAILLKSHMPLLESLEILKNQTFTPWFRKILEVIYEDVKGGVLLSEALKKHAKVFPEFFRSMVYVGEMSGKPEAVMEALADYYERDAIMRQKLKGAMAYPTMLFCMMLGIVLLMLMVVVPTFREALAELEVPITGITRVVYDISDFIMTWWPVMLLGVILAVLLALLCLRTPWGRYSFDAVKIKLPLLGRMQIHMLTARFARAFGLLLSSGMDLTDAMDAVSVVLTNRYVKRRFLLAAERVRQGMSLTQAFVMMDIFPVMLTKMVAIGERTNALDDVLMRSCAFFDMELETSHTAFTARVQPVMMLLLGVVVMALFLAVYAPMLSIMDGL